MENFLFYILKPTIFFNIRLGVVASEKPVPVIIISLVFTLLGCLGLLLLRVENNAIKLWIPQESDFTKNYHWLYENYPPEIRQHSIIIHGDDVLTPEAIQKVSFLYRALRPGTGTLHYIVDTTMLKCCLNSHDFLSNFVVSRCTRSIRMSTRL